MNNDKIMTLGINQARKTMNDNKGGPFGAVITDKKGNIISISSNLVLETYDPTAHAEINAIREASKKLKTHDLSNCILYATGYPCPMCLSAIIWANIQTVYYGTNVNEAEEIGFRDNLIYEYLEGQSKTSNKEDILKIIAMDREETIKTFESYQNKSENKTMY